MKRGLFLSAVLAPMAILLVASPALAHSRCWLMCEAMNEHSRTKCGLRLFYKPGVTEYLVLFLVRIPKDLSGSEELEQRDLITQCYSDHVFTEILDHVGELGPRLCEIHSETNAMTCEKSGKNGMAAALKTTRKALDPPGGFIPAK